MRQILRGSGENETAAWALAQRTAAYAWRTNKLGGTRVEV